MFPCISGGIADLVMASHVLGMSMKLIRRSMRAPGLSAGQRCLNFSGMRTMNATRVPESKRKRLLRPMTPPLSEVKITMVSSARPSASSLARILPNALSAFITPAV